MRIQKGLFLGCWVLFVSSLPSLALSEELKAEEVVGHCYYKYAGKDQRSGLMAKVRDAKGKEKTYDFIRLWKNYEGDRDGLVDKVVIFTLTPLASKGITFMRWGYTAESGREADQWVYLPETRMIRRIARRDPSNGDWGLNDEELRIRDLHEDDHRYLGEKHLDGQAYYVVESRPKSDPVYSKRIAWYLKTGDWKTCVEGRLDFYDKSGELVKTQLTTWDHIDGAWVWRTVMVKNMLTNAIVTYEMKDVEVNVGLRDSDFSQRALKRGYRR